MTSERAPAAAPPLARAKVLPTRAAPDAAPELGRFLLLMSWAPGVWDTLYDDQGDPMIYPERGMALAAAAGMRASYPRARVHVIPEGQECTHCEGPFGACDCAYCAHCDEWISLAGPRYCGDACRNEARAEAAADEEVR